MAKKTTKTTAKAKETDAAEENGQATPEAAAATGLPLFYNSVALLNIEAHGDLRLRPAKDVSFAKEATSIVLAAAEIPEAALSYPIVFSGTGEEIAAYGVMGTGNGKNAFVSDDGQWDKTKYMPAYMRRYPFIMVEDKANDSMSLAVDPTSDMLSTDTGSHIYEDGKPSDAAKGALQFCVSYSRELEKSRVLFAQIDQMGLLVDRQAQVKLADGTESRLTGFRVVDEAELNKLDDDKFIELRKTGALTLIYCHLWSMRRWQNILG